MQIKIGERFRPFSRVPGTIFPIPGLYESVVAYPDLFDGPIQKFCCMADLEKGKLIFCGSHTLEGGKPSKERLSLGSSKKQDWDMIRRRNDFREIIPILYKLAGFYPEMKMGKATLIDEWEGVIQKKNKLEIIPTFEKIFRVHFTGVLQPRLLDGERQNIPHHAEGDPFYILQQCGRLIKRLFVQEGETLALLPCLPPEFVFGRFTDVELSFGTIDMEWSKKILRRVIVRPRRDVVISLELQKEIADFRFQGRTVVAGATLPLLGGQTYYLDRFQK